MRKMTIILLLALPLGVTIWAARFETRGLSVGSKKFTESVILSELLAQLVQNTGQPCTHRAELGGTQILWRALRLGEIDIYPEYTGTLREEVLRESDVESIDDIRAKLSEFGLRMSEPLGFENNYAFGMNKKRAAELGIRKISDLRRYPELIFRFNNEFMERGDGWPAVRKHYQLPQRNVRGIDHDVAYRLLAAGEIDLMELYTTDAEIAYYDLAVLEDDLGHFPRYAAAILYRAALERTHPGVVRAIRQLERRIDATSMIALNGRAKLERVPEPQVAADYLSENFDIHVTIDIETKTEKLVRFTREHLRLVVKSLIAAVLVAVPLGVLAAKTRTLGQTILSAVGIVQTIPSLALLVLLVQPLSWSAEQFSALRAIGVSGLGEWPAMIALFLYSLLPIVRNTASGLQNIPPQLRESARALGLPRFARWRLIELPLASPTILAGIKTATVINIGFATLGALIGAGGYGEPILTGIRLDDYGLILLGAIPAAALALIAQVYFEIAERVVVPRGLCIRS